MALLVQKTDYEFGQTPSGNTVKYRNTFSLPKYSVFAFGWFFFAHRRGRRFTQNGCRHCFKEEILHQQREQRRGIFLADHHQLRHKPAACSVASSSTMRQLVPTAVWWRVERNGEAMRLTCRAMSAMHRSTTAGRGVGDRESFYWRKKNRSGSFLCLKPWKNKLESDECENLVPFYRQTKWWKCSTGSWHEAFKLFHAFFKNKRIPTNGRKKMIWGSLQFELLSSAEQKQRAGFVSESFQTLKRTSWQKPEATFGSAMHRKEQLSMLKCPADESSPAGTPLSRWNKAQ